jgi:glutamate dehydrogenase (NAD(P)+)
MPEQMKKLGLSTGIEGKRVVVQGLGNVGYHSAKFFQEAGAIIVGLAEYEGSIGNPTGLDVDAVVAHRKGSGSILNFPGATNLATNTTALELDCDILIPAALENVINGENAPRIKAKIVGEAANGPLTPDADDILTSKGVLVIPDMYLNAGGVTVSYFEWLKNLSHVRYGRLEKRFAENENQLIVDQLEQITGQNIPADIRKKLIMGADEVDLVRSGLEETMIGSTHEIVDLWNQHPDIKNMRTASFVVAINKVGTSYTELGIFP